MHDTVATEAGAVRAGMLKRWRFVNGSAAPDACRSLAQSLGVPDLIARLLHRRGQTDEDSARTFLEPKLTDLHDPALLGGTDRAAQRMEQAVHSGQPIVIYGDYDVDGITASAILWHVLKLAGANVTTYVPHRIEEGYGLNRQAVEQLCAATHNSRPLIISVDCGVTAVDPALAAAQAGVDLIITDHHEFDPLNLPSVHTIVHPRIHEKATPAYPFADLCGAGVALKLAWQFASRHCGSDRLPDQFKGLLLDCVSLAALGTIADIVPLVGENRVIAAHGLGQIKRTRFPGLNALIDASALRTEKIDAYHVGFVLGPRLNACGRMGHAREAVALLTTADAHESAATAQFLTKENDRRRATERAIFEEAAQMVVDLGYDHADRRAIVLGKQGWHAGVVGIVASRLVERFCRPVVMLNFGDDGEAHGSARSVDGVSIHDAFSACARHLTSFGGHAMAAGLRLKVSSVDPFRESIIQYVNQRLSTQDLVNVLDIDGECLLSEVNTDLCSALRKLAPFGRGNDAPTMCVNSVTLVQPPLRMGQKGDHLRLTLRQNGRIGQAVWFNSGEHFPQLAAACTSRTELDVAFEPKASTWQGITRARCTSRT